MVPAGNSDYKIPLGNAQNPAPWAKHIIRFSRKCIGAKYQANDPILAGAPNQYKPYEVKNALLGFRLLKRLRLLT